MSTTFITRDELESIIPGIKDAGKWCNILNDVLPRYDINTRERIAGFIAQCAHESCGFTRFIENLNYSERGLLATFSKYFTPTTAKQYARKPEQIANLVYANRMGNGSVASGDGWKFRGRGLIQITGRSNYEALAESLEKTVDETIDYLGTLHGAVESAAWFWKTNGINRYADTENITKMTQKINGGVNGLQDRIAYFERALTVLVTILTVADKVVDIATKISSGFQKTQD